jgi:hypothetical protein
MLPPLGVNVSVGLNPLCPDGRAIGTVKLPVPVYKDKGCARTWSSLDLPFAISSPSNSISLALDQRFLLSPLSALI